MFDFPRRKGSIVKVGFATLGLVWSVQTILMGLTNGAPKPPEGQEDAAMMFAFVFYIYFFLAVVALAFSVRYFYKTFFAVSDIDVED